MEQEASIKELFDMNRQTEANALRPRTTNTTAQSLLGPYPASDRQGRSPSATSRVTELVEDLPRALSEPPRDRLRFGDIPGILSQQPLVQALKEEVSKINNSSAAAQDTLNTLSIVRLEGERFKAFERLSQFRESRSLKSLTEEQ